MFIFCNFYNFSFASIRYIVFLVVDHLLCLYFFFFALEDRTKFHYKITLFTFFQYLSFSFFFFNRLISFFFLRMAFRKKSFCFCLIFFIMILYTKVPGFRLLRSKCSLAYFYVYR